ncbi:MAG: adaptor protein MecA [Clostridiales bacterium]|nr:adaptor protein MecA [Clostridiales bacterium]
MKIEKLNDQQIRCTLTREDLASRHIRLAELAYGSEKARALFRDMMEQASHDYGFDVEDIPIMIEAIPMSSEQIVLIITKVDTPEELDTRFSEFTHFGDDYPVAESGLMDAAPDIPEELIELLSRIRDELAARESSEDASERAKAADLASLFAFSDMEEAIPAARAVDAAYLGKSTLYRDEEEGVYLLYMHCGKNTPQEFNRITHTVGGYLNRYRGAYALEAYAKEHGRLIIRDKAISTLAQL